MNITPLKNYSPPKFPTLAAARENPDLLKALPVRWQKIFRNTAAFACAGVIGFSAVSGTAFAAEIPAAIHARLEAAELSLSIRTHAGGDGGIPHYVVHFTEQEAWGFIRAKLEAAGHNFDALPAGAFYNPERQVGADWRPFSENEVTAEEKEEFRAVLIENLTAQAQGFLDNLPPPTPPPSEITVTLNGEPLVFDVEPQIVGDRTLVPMRAIFEALGFNVVWNSQNQSIRAESGGTTISMRINAPEMQIDDGRLIRAVSLDVPPQIVNGRTLVPLRAIAEATGAHVQWDAASQTAKITATSPAPRTFAELREYFEAHGLQLSSHMGGAGAGPFYVARFTEQEAFGFILAMLEDAGLDFSFAQKNIAAGAFSNPSSIVGDSFFRERTLDQTPEEAREAIIQQLTAQAQNFIDRLREEGIL